MRNAQQTPDGLGGGLAQDFGDDGYPAGDARGAAEPAHCRRTRTPPAAPFIRTRAQNSAGGLLDVLACRPQAGQPRAVVALHEALTLQHRKILSQKRDIEREKRRAAVAVKQALAQRQQVGAMQAAAAREGGSLARSVRDSARRRPQRSAAGGGGGGEAEERSAVRQLHETLSVSAQHLCPSRILALSSLCKRARTDALDAHSETRCALQAELFEEGVPPKAAARSAAGGGGAGGAGGEYSPSISGGGGAGGLTPLR